LPTDRRDPHGRGEARSAHGCENTHGMAPPSVWSARLSVSHRRAADSRCTVVNPVPGAAVGTETGQATLSSALGDFRRVLHPPGTDRSHFRESALRPSELTIGASATPQFGGWLRNPRSLGVSLPVTELPRITPTQYVGESVAILCGTQ
jgi:hypothetical protein